MRGFLYYFCMFPKEITSDASLTTTAYERVLYTGGDTGCQCSGECKLNLLVHCGLYPDI